MLEEVEIFRGGLGLNENDDVVQQLGESRGQLAECLLDELLEFARRDHQPGMMLNPNVRP